MVRPTQQLHVPRAPVAPAPAATLLLMRDTPGGLEVLMTRRSHLASFAPQAYVFPGGRVEDQDTAARPIARRRRTQSRHHLAHAVAAVRETYEELGVLLAEHADGRPLQASDVAAFPRQLPEGTNFAEQCAARRLLLSTDRIWPLAHWVTDRDLPKRFDVLFLVARMPEGQTPVADEVEQFEPTWVRPSEALAKHEAGEFPMIFPTVRTLEHLAGYGNVDAVLLACVRDKPLWSSCPRGGWLQGREERYSEQDAPYGELALSCPDGQLLHKLDWQTHSPVSLLRNVRRLTAPNPSAMTGPGTNSYLVGDASTGYIVIDPGPNDFGHLGRLWRAANGDIRAIVCTHSHSDHAPGAQPLQAMCQGHPPILGLSSGPAARTNSRFTPERELADGEQLVLHNGSDDGAGRITHTLRVVHTPGHAANHLCLFLEEDGLLFSGDHVLNGSTTVIDPPDGNMSHYLASLDKLDSLCETLNVEFILPAHGYVLGFARDAIARLKAHRLQREAKVAAAMRQLPDGHLEDWLTLAYSDTPRTLWPVAMRSLRAHVDRIRDLNAERDPAPLGAR